MEEARTAPHSVIRSVVRAAVVAAVVAGTTAFAAFHNIHATSTRMVIEGPNVVARIRIFSDDLAKGLGSAPANDAKGQAVLAKYLNAHIELRADGVVLSGEVLDGSSDVDGNGQKVWQVLVQYAAKKPVRTISLKQHVLFETFRDQQNLVTVLKSPGEERRSLYFQAGDLKEQVLTF